LGQQARLSTFEVSGAPCTFSNQIREVIEIGVAIFVSRDFSQLGANITRITDDDWRTTVQDANRTAAIVSERCFHEAVDARVIFI